MKLWEMDERLEAMIHEATDRETGEISEEALFEIEHLEMDREKKLLSLAGYIKGERAEAAAVATQAERLSDRAKSHNRRADRLQKYMERHLKRGEEMRDDRHWLHWRKSTAVEVLDEKKLPAEFMVQPPQPPLPDKRPDKKALAAALKNGDVPGARLDQRMKLVLE